MLDFGPSVPDSDQPPRAAQRFALLLRPVKVITACGEYLAILRDVSATGLRLRLFHPLPAGPRMTIELANGDCYEASKVWERDGQAGFQFTHEAEIRNLLEEQNRYRKGHVRIRIELPARLTAAGETYDAVLHDLSQQGGRIGTEAHLAIDQRVRLEARGLPRLDAKVRWRRGAEAGLIFEQTFRLDELARVIAGLQPVAPPADDDDLFGKVRLA